MMQTTLRKIRAAGPCGMRLKDGKRVGYLKLRHHLGKGYGDDTPVDIATIIDSNGVDDALWCLRAVDGHAREMRLYAVWCARQVQSLLEHRCCQRRTWRARSMRQALWTEIVLCVQRRQHRCSLLRMWRLHGSCRVPGKSSVIWRQPRPAGSYAAQPRPWSRPVGPKR